MLKRLLPVMMIAVSLLFTGCDGQGVDEPKTPTDNPPPPVETQTPDPKPEPQPSEPPPPSSEVRHDEPAPQQQNAASEDLNIKVFYPDESGLRLVEVNREIKVANDADKYAEAIKQIMTPPTEQELTEIFPKHSNLIDVKVDNGVATVNFDSDLQKHFIGGSTGEEFLIGSVVNTLTNFDEVKEVKFLIDGQEVETLAGHMDLTQPIKRMNDLIDN